MSDIQLETDWLVILRDAVARFGSMRKVAEILDVSHAAISTALAGKYPAGTEKLERKVLRSLKLIVDCPHLGVPLAQQECAHHRTRRIPSSSREKLLHWVACQTCPIGDRFGWPRDKAWEDAHAE